MPKVKVNGYSLNYEEVGSGAPAVFLANTIDDSAPKWTSHMAEHAASFRVVIPDLRGLAGSEHSRDVEPADWVKDLGGLLDALGLPSVCLFTETLGTRIGVRFAVEQPQRVKALVLNGAIAVSDASGDAWRRRRFSAPNISPELQASLRGHHGDDWQAVVEFYVAMHERDDFKAYYDLLAIADKVQAPALVLRGDIDDEVHPIAHSVELHRRIPRSWLAIHPNTPFNVMTARPQDYWALVRRFVAETADA